MLTVGLATVPVIVPVCFVLSIQHSTSPEFTASIAVSATTIKSVPGEPIAIMCPSTPHSTSLPKFSFVSVTLLVISCTLKYVSVGVLLQTSIAPAYNIVPDALFGWPINAIVPSSLNATLRPKSVPALPVNVLIAL